MKRFLLVVSFSLLLAGITQVAFAGFSLIPGEKGVRQFSFELDPGKSIESTVIIDNLSTQPLTVKVYGADGTQSNLGTFALTTRATEQRYIGSWVSFSEDKIEIEPMGRKELPFTVSVPANATPGVYSGGIAAEAGSTQNGETQQGSSVSTSSRVVVKLFVSVSGEKVTKIDWKDFSYKNGVNDNIGAFRLQYNNTGNTVIIADQKIEISGLFGLWKKNLPLTAATILQSKDVVIPLKWDSEPFFGFYSAKAVVTFSEYDIIKNTPRNPLKQEKEISIFLPLKIATMEGKITVAVLIALLALIVALVFKVLSRRRMLKNSRPYTVKNGDTLTGLASKSGISWKNLAKLNKLGAPYTLKEGRTILLPTPKK